MSTKICDGYALATTDLQEVYQLLLDFHRQIEPLQIKLLSRAVAADAVAAFDRWTLTGRAGEQPQTMWQRAGRAVREVEDGTRRHGTRPERYDFTWSVALFPRPWRTLAIAFIGDDAIRRAWTALPLVSDFHYQNQTDRPQDLTAEEWETRRLEWREALPGLGVPCDTGLLYEPRVGWWRAAEPRALVEAAPALVDRAALMAREQMFDRFLAGRETSIETIGLLLYDFGEWLRANPGVLPAETERVRPLLRHPLTHDDWTGVAFGGDGAGGSR